MGDCILVTGGAGFVGSHSCVALAEAGYTPLILDNLGNSDVRVVERLGRITGTVPTFIEGDVRDRALLDRVFAMHDVAGVMHFAGLKAVGDSVRDPIGYYDNNVNGSLVLAAAMQQAGVKTLIFSSSATVYGEPERSPIPEDAPRRPANPYGHSKRMVEQALADLQHAQPEWRIALLRYFNPVGAHESGLIGEHPQGKPNNLMPFVCQVAVGQRAELAVHGGDYPTHDGTGVRDYVHVMDLAEGHVAALRHVAKAPGLLTLNLGSGRGASVLDVVKAFERASGRPVAHTIGPRRPGDVSAYWGDASLAEATMGWRARRDLDQMCADSWRWQQGNPRGYE
ncbi:UDP-glucose 4-epimerase GalE [Variovorax guangxiensis]|uniref:UDP-glucose 4-epimerase n=1 Tax=Variovorax guangxiensis TaxID=1775474 RepID=A0A502DTI2_9BURK|nr:UDP-glucose 4-epimerase GalE [Variovorax guangxiensis]RZI64937.1 MAG: UDP-glucose 4-epimerase GalE [Variovorax sp.]TPG24535.1 UDP-glucose 4-epimerase GalE [Variovorax ginsengisoli]TPG28785.1 UDP-glucose 4-epimerase GalE [Variovorax guangxiensis]